MTRQLHDLLDSAAVSQVPDGLADRAVAGARDRRRHRFELGAALALVVLLVAPVGWVAMRSSSHIDQTPAPVMGSAGLPDRLPDAVGLPMLSDAPMEAASVVYLDAGLVVAVDAETGEGAYIYPDSPDPFAADYDMAQRAYVSPDGQKVLLSFGPGGRLVLIELPSGEQVAFRDLRMPDLIPDGPAMLAWSPNSEEFACICARESGPSRVNVFALSDLVDRRFEQAEGYTAKAGQLAWGSGGLAIKQINHDEDCGPTDSCAEVADAWSFVDPVRDIDVAVLLALQLGGEGGRYLAAGRGSGRETRCWIGSSSYYLDGRIVLPDGPVPDVQYDGGCEVVSVGTLGDGFVMTMPSGEVVAVNTDGDTTLVSQLPRGATSPTFAADVLSQPDPPLEPSAKPTPATEPSDEFPSSQGLPSWRDRPVEQAAAAFVSDGQLVLVDAETGDGAIADLDVGSRDELLMSPDGRRLLWIQVPVGPDGAVVDGSMVLVDLASGNQVPLDVRVSANTGAAPEASVAAWMDDNALYCLCGDTLGADDVRAPVNLLLSPDGGVSRVDQVSGFDQAGAPEVDAITFGAAPGPAVHLAAGGDLTQGWYWATTADTWQTWQDQVWWQADDVAMGATSLALLERRDGVWEVTVEDLYGSGRLARMPLPNVDDPFLTSATGGGFGVVMVSDGAQELLFISDDGAVTSTIRPFAEPVAKLTVAGDWLAEQAPT